MTINTYTTMHSVYSFFYFNTSNVASNLSPMSFINCPQMPLFVERYLRIKKRISEIEIGNPLIRFFFIFMPNRGNVPLLQYV